MMTPASRRQADRGILNGWSYRHPQGRANPADAKKFVQFLNTADNMGFFTDTFPARISALNLPRFQDPMLKPISPAMLHYGRPTPQHAALGRRSAQAMFNGISAHPARRRRIRRRRWTGRPRRSRRSWTS